MNEAYIGLVGVAVGGFIAIFKDLFASLFKQRKNAEYLAIQIVCIIDEFIDKCYEIVVDDGTDEQGRPAGKHDNGNGYYQEFLEPQIDLPNEVRYPSDIDWKSIDAKTMYRILMLPNTIRNTNQSIYLSSEHSFEPNHEPIFEARQNGYAKLGLEAAKIEIELRKAYKLPAKERELYNPIQKFEETILKFEQKNGGR